MNYLSRQGFKRKIGDPPSLTIEWTNLLPEFHGGWKDYDPESSRVLKKMRIESDPKNSAAKPDKAAVSRFSDWDKNDPSSADGFTHIFNKVRVEKQGGSENVPYMTNDSYSNAQKQVNSDISTVCTEILEKRGTEADSKIMAANKVQKLQQLSKKHVTFAEDLPLQGVFVNDRAPIDQRPQFSSITVLSSKNKDDLLEIRFLSHGLYALSEKLLSLEDSLSREPESEALVEKIMRLITHIVAGLLYVYVLTTG